MKRQILSFPFYFNFKKVFNGLFFNLMNFLIKLHIFYEYYDKINRISRDF